MNQEDRQPVFFFDLSDPWCYIAAEQILGELPVVAEWVPVHGADLGLGLDEPPELSLIVERVAELGLQPLRWPAGWPPEGRLAALAATYAKGGGRAVAFSQAAFRQGFAGGRDLDDEATVLLAGAACEMHPAAILKGITLRSTALALERAGTRARTLKVTRLPAIIRAGQAWSGADAVLEAVLGMGEPTR